MGATAAQAQGIDAAGQAANFDGNAFLYSPETAGSLTFIYDRPLTDSHGLSLTFNGRYQDESYGNLANDDDHAIDSYSLFNANTAVRFPGQGLTYGASFTYRF